MSDEQRLILEMVQQGKVSPDEAERLLAELTAAAPAVTTVQAASRSPDMRHFRRYWEYPFFVGVILLGVAGLCVSNTGNALLLICGWGVFLLAASIAVAGWLSQWSPWLHVRIQEEVGSRLAFSFPLPLIIFKPLIGFARPWVRRYAGEDTVENLDTAALVLDALQDLPANEPITIEVDEEDGDHVRVFIG